jgi:hypothetical protein
MNLYLAFRGGLSFPRHPATEFEVDSFVFKDVGAALDVGEDVPYVFANNSQEDHLHGAQEEDADYQWSDSYGELLPVEQLVCEIG